MHSGPQDITITTTNLGKRFNREWIFRDLNLTFSAGNTYAITGPNGSGKSTLLQILWGQMPPSTGKLSYTTANTGINHEDIYQHITIAAPYMDLIDEFTLEEQLRFHFKMKPARDHLSVDAMLERMYLADARDKFIANFSSGMRQRVKLALAFFTQADLIFLDEPGTNLDRNAFDWYQNELTQVPASCIVFIASNQPSEYPSSAQKIDILSYK